MITYEDLNQYNNFAGWLLVTEDFVMLGENCLAGGWIQEELPLGGR